MRLKQQDRIAIGFALGLALICTDAPASAAQPTSVLQLLEAIDQAQPVDPPTLGRLIGHDLRCMSGKTASCTALNVTVGDETVGVLSYETHFDSFIWNQFARKPQLLFVSLSGFKPCLTAASLEAAFGKGRRTGPSNDGDSLPNPTIAFKRPWGGMIAALPMDPKDTCVEFVAMTHKD